MILALVWSERLLALAVLFQTLELLNLRPIWSDTGIWRWSQVRRDYEKVPVFLIKLLDFFLLQDHFHRLLQVRLLCSILIWIYPSALFTGVLFFSTWLIGVRWRGMFNGGSDSMTLLLALGLWVARLFQGNLLMVKAAFAYIAIHLTGSYLIAGMVKLRNLDWRSGKAIPLFFETPRYDSPPEWVRSMMNRPELSILISWVVILFEITFPLAWFSPIAFWTYFILAMIFHVSNFYVFGLNRFVFIWAAAYPAFYFWVNK